YEAPYAIRRGQRVEQGTQMAGDFRRDDECLENLAGRLGVGRVDVGQPHHQTQRRDLDDLAQGDGTQARFGFLDRLRKALRNAPHQPPPWAAAISSVKRSAPWTSSAARRLA